MLIHSRDRAFRNWKVREKSAQDAAAEKPVADFEPVWGKASSTAPSS